LEEPGIDGRIILRWIFRKWDVVACTGSVWLRMWTGGSTCEWGNELFGSTKCGEFLDLLRTDLLLKKDSAPWSKEVSK